MRYCVLWPITRRAEARGSVGSRASRALRTVPPCVARSSRAASRSSGSLSHRCRHRTIESRTAHAPAPWVAARGGVAGQERSQRTVSIDYTQMSKASTV